MLDPSKWTMHRENYLSNLITQKQEALNDVPEGILRVCANRKSPQFYVRSSDTGPNGRYLKKNEKDLIQSLAQKRYDQRVLEAAKKENSLLHKLNRLYKSNETVEMQYEKEPISKQSEITPIQLPDDQFVERWLSIPYAKLDFQGKAYEFFSDKEEQMRSKSEVIIANMLLKYNIPYRYECPLKIDGRLVYPDFTILNVPLRKEIYWEHLGMLDDAEYLEKALVKITRYEMNGYFPGDRLILTYESSETPLNMNLVSSLIKRFCQ